MNTQLKTLVQQAHHDQDAATLQYLDRAHIQISCRKGCAFCCHAMVVLGLAEAEYLYENVKPEVLERTIRVGEERMNRLTREKDIGDFATRFFLEANPCPLLQDGACTAYTARPLACRGVLTNLDSSYCKPGAVPNLEGKALKEYQTRLGKHHGPEHYLRIPWRSSEGRAQALWEAEQKQRGFTVIGELATMLYLLHQAEFGQALEQGQTATKSFLNRKEILGGDWGLWVG